MKSFSDQTISVDQLETLRNSIREEYKAEIAKLRNDTGAAVKYLAISIAANVIVSLAAAVAAVCYVFMHYN